MGNAQASHADHHRRHSGGRGGQGGIILPNDKAPGFGNRETSPYEPVRLSAAVTKKYYILKHTVCQKILKNPGQKTREIK